MVKSASIGPSGKNKRVNRVGLIRAVENPPYKRAKPKVKTIKREK